MATIQYSDVSERIRTFAERELGRGAMTQEIEEAERALGLRIEGGFRRFVEEFGWGGVAHLELYGIGEDAPKHLDLVRVTQSERLEVEPRLPATLLPLMNDGGGNLHCLDTSTTGEPNVVFWEHTGGADQDPEEEAESFVIWLSSELDAL